ncbi:MAG: conserved hypothetical transrane protein [Proteobacteria bacterium]|nr:conserved hypothetical transrane protein [Pseudomonadota bacterium]
MNTQERDQLNNFLSQLVAARAGQKDAEADGLIREAVARQPEATYLLVQKAFLLEQAVSNSQARIEQLQGEVDALRACQPRSSFAETAQWGNSAGRMPFPSAAPPVAAMPAQMAAPSLGSGWLGNVATNVATTAAGVAAGAFLFQGIEHLIGHHDSTSLFGGNALPQPHETPVVNNFFDTDSLASSGSGFDGLSDGLDSGGDSSWI